MNTHRLLLLIIFLCIGTQSFGMRLAAYIKRAYFFNIVKRMNSVTNKITINEILDRYTKDFTTQESISSNVGEWHLCKWFETFNKEQKLQILTELWIYFYGKPVTNEMQDYSAFLHLKENVYPTLKSWYQEEPINEEQEKVWDAKV